MNYVESIENINGRYNYLKASKFRLSYECSSRKKLFALDLDTALFINMKDEANYENLKQYIRFITNYEYHYSNYINEYNKYYDSLLKEIDNLSLSFRKLKLKFFVLSKCNYLKFEKQEDPKFNLEVFANYTSPEGKNFSSRIKNYPYDEFLSVYEKLEQKERVKELNEEKKKQFNTKFGPKLNLLVMEKDDFRCVHCGKTRIEDFELTIEHIIPISKGGETVVENLQTVCNTCKKA